MLFPPPLANLLVLLVFLLVPFLLIFLPVRVFQAAYARLGIPPLAALAVLFASLVGSLVNIPLARFVPATGGYAMLSCAEIRGLVLGGSGFEGSLLAVNLGGAVIPVLVCLALLPRAPLRATLVCSAIMTLVCYLLARPVPGVGIMIPAFLPPAAAILGALVVAPRPRRAIVAYISGVTGVLVGADLLHLASMPYQEGVVMSIGGAGVFDGIFLVGVLAALFA